MAGRPRKPTARHKAEGTARADRINEREPQYPVEAPEKPAHIEASPHASAVWDATVDEMLKQRTIAAVFLPALEAYCVARAKLVTAAEGGKLDGTASKELRSWAVQLGLTPASSGKVSSVPVPERRGKFAVFMGGKGREAG